MHPKTLASIPKGIATTRDEAIEMAIRDYSAVARLKYISKKELLSKAMILGLCDYFDCRSIYDLAWKNIKDGYHQFMRHVQNIMRIGHIW